MIARAATEDNEEIVRLFIKAGYIFTQKTDLSPDEIEGFFSESIFVWESMFEAIINNFSDTKLKGILIYFNNSITFEKFPIIRIGLILALMETNTGRIFSLIDLRSEFNITLNDFITILEYQNSWGLNLSPEKVYTGFKFLFSKEDIPKFVDKLKENQNIIPNARIYEKYFNSKREVLARIFK